MPRTPHPWPYQGWFVTNALGKPREKLCPISEGIRRATLILAQRLAGEHPELNEGVRKSPPLSLSGAVDGFLAFCKSEKDPSTHDWYEGKLGLVLRVLGEEKAVAPLSSLTGEDGMAMKASMLSGDSPYRGSTVNMAMRAARALLNWSVKKGYLQSNPWQGLNPAKEKGRERVLTEGEFEALLDNCQNGTVTGGAEDFREQLTMLRLTTMRPGELRKLEWQFINWGANRIDFPAEAVKTRKKRAVTLVDEAVDLLRKRKARLMRDYGLVFTLPGRLTPGGSLVASASCEPISAQAFQRRFFRLVERCQKKGLVLREKNGERLCLYTHRHSAITALAQAGLPLTVVQLEAGHSSSRTTERYIHEMDGFTNTSVRAAMNKPKGEQKTDGSDK